MQVTIQEAAFRLGLSEKTVRRRVLSGRLPGSQMATPQGFAWMVDIPDDLPESGGSFGELTALRELNTALQCRIDAQDKQLEAKDEQIRELHVLLQQVQAALPSPGGTQRSWWRSMWRRD